MNMRRSTVVVCATLAAFAGGCGPKVVESVATDRTGENLFQFSRMYVAAQEKLHRPPRSADDLKAVAAQFPDAAKHLVSPNDDQPYVVVWGVDLQNPTDHTLVVAYEKVGKGGFRYVLTPTGVDRLSAEKFHAAKFPPGHKP